MQSATAARPAMKPASLARLALGIALVAGLALAFANREQFSQESLQAWLAAAGWWAPVLFIAIYAAGTVLFWWLFAWFAPEPVPRHLLWVGAMVGAAALVVLQSLAGLLVGLFSGNLSAGIFGSVIVLMLFLNLFATLILYVAAWLATSRAPVPQALAEVETVSEPEPVALVEGRPGDLYVSSEVAQRSLGIGLTTGYAVGAATGVGIGALLVAGIRAVFGRKRA